MSSGVGSQFPLTSSQYQVLDILTRDVIENGMQLMRQNQLFVNDINLTEVIGVGETNTEAIANIQDLITSNTADALQFQTYVSQQFTTQSGINEGVDLSLTTLADDIIENRTDTIAEIGIVQGELDGLISQVTTAFINTEALITGNTTNITLNATNLEALGLIVDGLQNDTTDSAAITTLQSQVFTMNMVLSNVETLSGGSPIVMAIEALQYGALANNSVLGTLNVTTVPALIIQADTLESDLTTLTTYVNTLPTTANLSSAVTTLQTVDTNINNTLFTMINTTIPALATVNQLTAAITTLNDNDQTLYDQTIALQTAVATNYQPIGSYLTTAIASSTYQPVGSYLTTASASTTYQPVGSYLTTTSAATTYQPIGGYLTSSLAAITYLSQPTASSTYQTQSSSTTKFKSVLQLLSLVDASPKSVRRYRGISWNPNTTWGFQPLQNPLFGESSGDYQNLAGTPIGNHQLKGPFTISQNYLADDGTYRNQLEVDVSALKATIAASTFPWEQFFGGGATTMDQHIEWYVRLQWNPNFKSGDSSPHLIYSSVMFQPTSKITAYDTTKAYTLSVGELTGNGALAGASVNIMDVTSQRMLIGDYQKLYIGLATKTNSGSASSYQEHDVTVTVYCGLAAGIALD